MNILFSSSSACKAQRSVFEGRLQRLVSPAITLQIEQSHAGPGHGRLWKQPIRALRHALLTFGGGADGRTWVSLTF